MRNTFVKEKSGHFMLAAVAIVFVATGNGGSKAKDGTHAAETPVISFELARVPQTNLVIGDKLKITVFEKMDVSSNNKLAVPSVISTSYQRMDLSGDYSIEADGSISVPRLGRFSIGPKQQINAAELQAQLTEAFERILKRTTEINVTVIERPAVFVTGSVINSGAHKFIPGMFVLQAVALAGGTMQRGVMSSSAIESLREQDRQARATEQLRRLHVRRARLEAESKGWTSIPVPSRLVGLKTTPDMKSLLSSETKLLNVHLSKGIQLREEHTAVLVAAKRERAILARKAEQMASHLKLKAERVADMQRLNARGLMTRNSLSLVLNDAADAEARYEDCLLAMAQIDTRIAAAQHAYAKSEADLRLNLAVAMNETDREIFEAEHAVNLFEAVAALENEVSVGPHAQGPPEIIYEIVRKSPEGLTRHFADHHAPLLPGDVLRVIQQPFTTSTTNSSRTPAETLPLRKI
jgi:polysaccharide biosynthesis/export protein ExoF